MQRKKIFIGGALESVEKVMEVARTIEAEGEEPIPWDQPRANVFIEYGLFAGQLGPKRTVIATVGNVMQATDLRGIITCNLDRHYNAHLQIRQWLRGLTPVSPVEPKGRKA